MPAQRARANRRGWLLAAGGALVAAVVVALVLFLVVFATPTRTMSGSMTIYDDYGTYSTTAQTCSGVGGYGDIDAGLPVTVTNGEGQVLGASSLQPGKVISSSTCELPFTLTDVPADEQFYVVKVGSKRGEVTWTADELANQGYKFELSLGQ